MIDLTASMVVYAGNGSAEEAYAIPFRFDEVGWLVVSLVDPAGVVGEAVLTGGVDYFVETIHGKGWLRTRLPVESGRQIRIRRRMPLTQHLDLDEGTTLAGEDVERALDLLTMGIQEMAVDGGLPARPLTFPSGDGVVSGRVLPPATADVGGTVDRRGTILAFHPLAEHPVTGVADGDLVLCPAEEVLDTIHAAGVSGFLHEASTIPDEILAEEDEEHNTLLKELNESKLSISSVITNGDTVRGTVFGYDKNGNESAIESLTIRPGDGAEGTNAMTRRSTLIGYGTGQDHTELGQYDFPFPDPFTDINGPRGHHMILGARSTSENFHALCSVGYGTRSYGYSHVSFGRGVMNCGSAPSEGSEEYDAIIGKGGSYFFPFRCTVIGQEGYSHGEDNVVIGMVAKANGLVNMAFGYGALANGRRTTAIGAESWAAVPYDRWESNDTSDTMICRALAVGYGAKTEWWKTLAAGAHAQTVDAPLCVALGTYAAARDKGAVAIGYGATSLAKYATTFSQQTVSAEAVGSVVFGYHAMSFSPQAVDITIRGRGAATPIGEPIIPGARMLLQASAGACVSYAATALKPSATSAARGSEVQVVDGVQHGCLGNGMLTFHSDGNTLQIHISDGVSIRTASASLT